MCRDANGPLLAKHPDLRAGSRMCPQATKALFPRKSRPVASNADSRLAIAPWVADVQARSFVLQHRADGQPANLAIRARSFVPQPAPTAFRPCDFFTKTPNIFERRPGGARLGPVSKCTCPAPAPCGADSPGRMLPDCIPGAGKGQTRKKRQGAK